MHRMLLMPVVIEYADLRGRRVHSLRQLALFVSVKFLSSTASRMRTLTISIVMAASLSLGPLESTAVSQENEPLPGTRPLVGVDDRPKLMRDGFRKHLQHLLDASVMYRGQFWKRDFSDRHSYETSVSPNRSRLRAAIGAVDRLSDSIELELIQPISQPAEIARGGRYKVFSIRWPVFKGVFGEGLLLKPDGLPTARVVVVPDADQTPEMQAGLIEGIKRQSQLARRLAEAGCTVVIPTLIDRQCTWSGNAEVARTNQTHREWITRQAFTMGRHIIGYEVQKVLAVVDWFNHQPNEAGVPRSRIGVAGYGEGGLIAFYAAALDTRIESALVSGYFDSRQRIFDEPLYRNVFGLLREFGDAEIATLIAPRNLIVHQTRGPIVGGPPKAGDGFRAVAAPGALSTPRTSSVRREILRAERLYGDHDGSLAWKPVSAFDEDSVKGRLATSRALKAFAQSLSIERLSGTAQPLEQVRALPDVTLRQKRQVAELVEHTQRLMRHSADVRREFWKGAESSDAKTWREQTASYRTYLNDQIVGRFPEPVVSPNARTRQIYDERKWTGYEVTLDVAPDVFAWGYLLVPKGMSPREKRPVVVCQHGLEGQPADVVDDDPTSRSFATYKGFAAKLADRGFIVYAPHNFYRGGNEFRQLQRMAHPLKKTLFGLTTIQHAQMLNWLSSLPFVDPKRIGFYGLSYGGNTAMRVPALLEQYAVVIASGDFNEWVYKNATVDYVHSMIYHNVYEVFEWNLGHTFNHGDLAALIAPRPFMVERGHDDGVALDEWVASEYARVRRLYVRLGIPERTEIEFFDGPHTINGVGTFAFLHKHLNWPAP